MPVDEDMPIRMMAGLYHQYGGCSCSCPGGHRMRNKYFIFDAAECERILPGRVRIKHGLQLVAQGMIRRQIGDELTACRHVTDNP